METFWDRHACSSRPDSGPYFPPPSHEFSGSLFREEFLGPLLPGNVIWGPAPALLAWLSSRGRSRSLVILGRP